jgi:hypothetical protein
MTEYVTGQIYGWNGGECPVHPETKVEVWFRTGVWANKKGDAGICSWDHSDDGTDIVCFQVVTPYVGPKTLWVNEYYDGSGTAYTTEGGAKKYADGGNTRIAVKYVEVKE